MIRGGEKSQKMQTYADIDGDSSVEAYEYTASSITIKFSGRATSYSGGSFVYFNTYKYTTLSAGETMVAVMKQKANDGDGLNQYINWNKPGYAERWES